MNVSNPTFRRRQQSLISNSSSTNPTTTTTAAGTSTSSSGSRSRSSSILSRRRTKRNSLTASTAAATSTTTTSASSSSPPQSNILQDIVACLSGQSEEIKHRIHTIITKWGGGSISGHFDPKFVTHLILDEPTGSKYWNWRRHLELYKKHQEQRRLEQHHDENNNNNNSDDDDDEIHNSAWAAKLIVVTTSWVEACQREGKRVSEEGYQLLTVTDEKGDNGDLVVGDRLAAASAASLNGNRKQNHHQHILQQQHLPVEILKRAPTLEERCEYMIQNVPTADYCSLFSGQSFLLVGFDWNDHYHSDTPEADDLDGRDDDDDDDDDDDENDNGADNPDDQDFGSETLKYGGADNSNLNAVIRSNDGGGDDDGGAAGNGHPRDLSSSCLPKKRKLPNGGHHHHVTSNRSGQSRRHRRLRLMRDKYQSLKISISKLIRRAGGTIFWEPNEWITTVVLHDDYSKLMWDDVRYFCREHPKGPICVTGDWILTSIFFHRERTKISMVTPTPPFPPEPRIQQTIKSKRNRGGGGGGGGGGGESSNNSMSSENTTSVRIPESKCRAIQSTTSTTSSIFRGDIFAISVSKPTSGTLTFRYEDMESTIISHGGLLLSKSLLLAIKNDCKKSSTSNTNRGYYVVSNSWVPTDGASSLPLLAELSKLGIKVVPVSLVWISACVKNDRKYDPTDYSLLFQPQTWPIRRLVKSASSTKMGTRKEEVRFSISVTGFLDSSRYGIMSMLDEIGADFTDNLTRKNTHLICKEGCRGLKYTKAMEWGLHVVSIEWLYHIIRYGYVEGSESKFALPES